jgi:hypothetical protein
VSFSKQCFQSKETICKARFKKKRGAWEHKEGKNVIGKGAEKGFNLPSNQIRAPFFHFVG